MPLKHNYKYMKKLILSLCFPLCCSLLSSCGGLNGMGGYNNGAATSSRPAAGGAAGTDIASVLGDIISTIAGNVLTNKNALLGTWTYTQPCVQFESESLLAKAGGSVIASKAEATLDTYYQKLGIRPGACQFVFSNDGTVQYNIGGKARAGKYVFDGNTKTVTITTQTGQSIKAYVSIAGNAMGLTFDASKLLALINTAASQSSSLSNISAIASNYTGMKLGFQFSR